MKKDSLFLLMIIAVTVLGYTVKDYGTDLERVFVNPPDLAADEPLKLRVFIDKSILEVFINGKQCIAMRVYPERDDSIGVSLRSQGKDAKLTSFVAYQMANIYK